MILEHIAIYTTDLERLKDFYVQYFGAKPNNKYHNPKTGLQTYFLTFEGGARLEIMFKPGLKTDIDSSLKVGLRHLAFRVGSEEKVNELTETLVNAGYALKSGPRKTGDGYYESCIFDPDSNEVEIVA